MTTLPPVNMTLRSHGGVRELHYQGDNTEAVGQVLGPTLLGQYLTIIAADYDEALDVTTVHLRPSTAPEVEAAGLAVSA